MISRHSVALSSKILSIYKQNSTGQLSIRIHLVAIDDDEVSITLLKDFRLDFGNQESPIVASYFAANLDTDKIFIGGKSSYFCNFSAWHDSHYPSFFPF